MKIFVVVASETPTLDEQVYVYKNEDEAYKKRLEIMIRDLRLDSECLGRDYPLLDKLYDLNPVTDCIDPEDEDKFYRIIGRYVRVYQFNI